MTTTRDDNGNNTRVEMGGETTTYGEDGTITVMKMRSILGYDKHTDT